MKSLLSLVLLALVQPSAASAEAPATFEQPAQAESAAEAWPPPARLRIVSAPDWSDHRIYPMAARRNHQEGSVSFELWVGRDGVPRACRILRSSGYEDLDSGTCDLGLQIRFAPPAGYDDEGAEASYRLRIEWLLADPVGFGAARMTAHLQLDSGFVSGCELQFVGPVPREWKRVACDTFARHSGYYFAAAPISARRATIIVELSPAGEPALQVQVPAGRLIAQRQTLFRLTRRGDREECRTTLDEGFGTPGVDHEGPCGFFLVNAWIRPERSSDGPRDGTFLLSVHVEPD